jgi:hypothetical protein
VSFDRLWPRKSASGFLPPPSAGGSFGPLLGSSPEDRAFRLEALHRRPSFDQRAVDRKMVRAQKPLHARLRQDRAQELRGDIALKQPVAVLGEHRMVPRRIVDAEADEPAEQQIELQSLHQLPLRTDRIERLQQHRSQRFLRRDRRPPNRRIKRRKIARQRRQRFVHNRADRAQRMALANPSFKIDITEKRSRPLVFASHDQSP